MIKLIDLLKEDFGDYLFTDPSDWKDVSDLIAYRSKYRQKEEPNTEEEALVHKLLKKWKTAPTGALSNNREFHDALIRIAKDRKFSRITQSNEKFMYRGSKYKVDNILDFAKTTQAKDWKNVNLHGVTDMSICSVLYDYRPTSLITSWSTSIVMPMEFIDPQNPIMYVQTIKDLDPGDYIFTGGESHDNSFDAIAQDNAGENEILGLAKEFRCRIAIPESFVMKLIRLNVIQRSDQVN